MSDKKKQQNCQQKCRKKNYKSENKQWCAEKDRVPGKLKKVYHATHRKRNQ